MFVFDDGSKMQADAYRAIALAKICSQVSKSSKREKRNIKQSRMALSFARNLICIFHFTRTRSENRKLSLTRAWTRPESTQNVAHFVIIFPAWCMEWLKPQTIIICHKQSTKLITTCVWIIFRFKFEQVNVCLVAGFFLRLRTSNRVSTFLRRGFLKYCLFCSFLFAWS